MVGLLIVPAVASPASASELLDQRLSAAQAVDSSCIDGLRGGPGVARHDFTAPTTGALTARLAAASGDWDVAAYRGDALVAAAAGGGPDEVAGGYVFEGEKLTLQACRRSGAGTPASRSSSTRSTPPRSP